MQKENKLTRRMFIKSVGGSIFTTALSGGLSRIVISKGEEAVVRTSDPGSSFNTLDPHRATIQIDKYPIRATFNALLRPPPGKFTLDADQLDPSLARSWESNREKTEYIFNLRRGVQFHHGYGELTAEDVKFSIERIEDPNTASPFIGSHKGWEVEIIDKYTVKISLPKYVPTFFAHLLNYNEGYIVSKKAVQDLGDDFAFNPIGTGAFEFAEHRPGDRVVLTPFEDHFRGVPKIDRAEYLLSKSRKGHENALLSHYAHLGTVWSLFKETKHNAESAGKLIVERFGYPIFGQFFINPNIPPFDDIRVRKAIQYAYNPAAEAKIIGEGMGYAKALTSTWPADLAGIGGLDLEEPIYPHNPEKSRELLAKAGYPNGFDAGTMVNYILTKDKGEVFQAALEEVGIRLRTQIRDWPTYVAHQRKGAQPINIYECTRIPDVSAYLREFLHSDSIGGNNFAQWSNKKFDQLLDEANVESDSERRKRLLQKAQMIALKEAIVTPSVARWPMGLRDNRVDLGYELKKTLIYGYYLTEDTKWQK